VDFAYTIHTEVGHHCIGAKVNGQIVPLKYELRNGDIVEILTSPNQKPNKDWLSFVKTGRARTKIRNKVRAEQRERSRELGRELLDKELKKFGSNIRTVEKNGKLEQAVEASKFNTKEEMLADLGYGKTPVDAIVERIFPPETRKKPRQPPKETRLGQLWGKITGRDKGVVLDGIEGVMVSYAKCCNPLPGDEITGFITRGRGLSVHQRDCDKIAHLEKERMIAVSWAGQKGKDDVKRSVNVKVFCADRPGMLATISQSFSDSGVNIAEAHCSTTEDERAVNSFEVMVKDLNQLQAAMKRIERIKGVYRVERS
jgi:GTP pyrophosphokinase